MSRLFRAWTHTEKRDQCLAAAHNIESKIAMLRDARFDHLQLGWPEEKLTNLRIELILLHKRLHLTGSPGRKKPVRTPSVQELRERKKKWGEDGKA